MTQDRDIERLLDRWLAEGPTQVADRVFDDAVERLDRQRQRPAWLLRRELSVSSPLKVALTAAVAAVAVAFVGLGLARPSGPGSNGVTPDASSSAAHSIRPSSSPSLAPVSCEDNLPGCAGPLTAGTHRSIQFEPGFTYETVGATGDWLNVIDVPAVFKIDQAVPGAPYALLWSDASIAVQDASCSATPDPSKGRKAADWIAMLTSHPGLVATTPVDIDVGGRRPAQQVELVLDPGWTATCPQRVGPHVSFLTQPIDGSAAEYGLGGSERVLLTVVDIGRRTIVIESYGPVDPALFASSTRSVRTLIASFRFTCSLNDGPCGSP